MNRTIRNILLITALTLLAIAHFAQSSGAPQSSTAGGGLAGTAWRVEVIDGAGVIDRSHATLRFSADGAVAGDSGCNHYTGTFSLNGPRLDFGPLAGARKACVPALMDQEQRFHAAMARVASWEVTDTGLLHLEAKHGETVIRAREVGPKPAKP